MAFEIDKDVVGQATECERLLACLSGKVEGAFCKITYIVAKDLYFIECTASRSCNYRAPLGDKMMCTCPVRQEIYNLYGVCHPSPESGTFRKNECPECGHRLRPGTLFCTNCGLFSTAELPVPTEPLPEEELPASEEELPIIDGYEDAIVPSTATALRITIARSTRQVVFPLPIDEISLGRADPAHDVFPDLDLTPDKGLAHGVSRHHARILQIRAHLFVEDVYSTNGTFLNGQRIAPYLPHILRAGDTLQLGSLKLRVEFD
jgi:hypothetical protein